MSSQRPCALMVLNLKNPELRGCHWRKVTQKSAASSGSLTAVEQ